MMFHPHASSVWNRPFAYLQMLRIMNHASTLQSWGAFFVIFFSFFFPRGVWLQDTAMSCKLKVNTLEGGIIILDITPTVTVRELKAMLLEQAPCEHPLERRILKAKLLNDKTLIDDAQASQTLIEAGLLHAMEGGHVAKVTVLYTRNEMEAVTSREIPLLSRLLQVNIPQRRFPKVLSKIAVKLSGWPSLSLWYVLRAVPLQGAAL